MWTAISSYIWGETDEQLVPGSVDDTQSVDDDWILVDVQKGKKCGEWKLLCLNYVFEMLFKAKMGERCIHFFSRSCISKNTFSRISLCRLLFWSQDVFVTTILNWVAPLWWHHISFSVISKLALPQNHHLSLLFSTDEKENDDPKLKAQIQLEESWYVTPPPCFEASGLSPEVLEASPMEDLLIEHPSMSVYGPGIRRHSPSLSSTSRNSSTARNGEEVVERREPRRTVQFQAQLELIEKRRQTEPPLQGSIRANRKNLKKQNMVHFQSNSRSKRNKKRNRMLGKHVGLHGKRGCWPSLEF